MADAARHRFDVVAVAAFDRMARSVRHLLETLECRPAGARARNTVIDVGLHDLPSAMGRQLLEVQQLAFMVLVDGADASVECRAGHKSSWAASSTCSSSINRRWRPIR